MEILGIGLPELTFIILLVLVLIGPKDMAKTGRTVGRWLRDFLESPAWQAMRTTGKAISDLPTQLVREANLERWEEEAGKIGDPQGKARPPFSKPNVEAQGYSQPMTASKTAPKKPATKGKARATRAKTRDE